MNVILLSSHVSLTILLISDVFYKQLYKRIMFVLVIVLGLDISIKDIIRQRNAVVSFVHE